MKPSNELFVLIKTLTKSEKRFFKLSSSIQTGDKNYLKLFDYIDSQSEYDEKVLKHHFRREKFINHLPSEKNHLYKLILKSLRSYHSDLSISSQLKEELKNIEILYNKALYKECRKFLKKSKKLAWEHEKFYYLIDLISWEKRLIEEAYEEGDFTVNLEELIIEEALVVDKLQNLADYHILYSKINSIFRSGGFSKNKEDREKVAEIADHQLIKGKHTAKSYRAASICYYIKGLCAATNRNYKDSYIFFNKTKFILDNHPKLKKDLSKRYMLTLYHLMRCYRDDNQIKEALNILEEIRNLNQDKLFQSLDLKVKLFSIHYNESLQSLNFLGEFEKSSLFREEKEHDFLLYKDKLNKEQLIQLAFNVAYLEFGLENYKSALAELNFLLNDNEQTLRQDLYSFARILNLLIHFELSNYEYLEYILKSTNRYLKKVEKDYKIELVIVKYIQRLIRTDLQNQKSIFISMKKDVDLLFKVHEERVVQEYFDLTAWIESKISDIPFGLAVKMKYVQ